MNAAAARSYLFVPGDNEALIGKALRSEADAVVMDLEDAVAPQRLELGGADADAGQHFRGIGS